MKNVNTTIERFRSDPEREKLFQVAKAELEAVDLCMAISFASKWHGEQLDKCGLPYILHPIRVMLRCNTNEERMVAVLHDVIEDTDATEGDLNKEFFSKEVIEAVLALTRGKDETYKEYIARVIANPLASRVKLADLEDNMDINRLPVTFAGSMPGYSRYAESHLKIRKAHAWV